jgi:hypothetical protein
VPSPTGIVNAYEQKVVDHMVRPECQWNAEDDSSTQAWKSGWAHSYFGIDSGYLVEDELDMYELGRRDGAKERQAVLARGLSDPHRW